MDSFPKKYKVLNLYACLGGNRYKWDEVAKEANIEIEVTAVELDPELAKLYKERFPNDIVLVEDAHEYLLKNYMEFHFIWTSPPCPTHSRARYWVSSSEKTNLNPKYPDMKLYQEILFLQHFYKGQYCVENVIPYYEPLIQAKKRGRHLYWTNFNLPAEISERSFRITQEKSEVKNLCKFHDFDFYKYKGEQALNKIARNLVDYEAGKTIFEVALGVYKKKNENQIEINF